MSRLPRSISTSTLLLVVVAVVVLAQLLAVTVAKGNDVPWLMWLLAPVYALYVTASLLVGTAVVARLRGRPPLPVPLLPERWRTQRTTFIVLGAFVALVTLLREGAFEPTCTLDYDAYESESRTNTSHNGSRSSSHFGDQPPATMAGRPVRCELHCSRPGSTCQAVLEEIRCDDDRDPNLPLEGAVSVYGSIALDDPACYVPLYKSTHTRFDADLTAGLDVDSTQASASISIDGTIDQDSTGPMSCRTHRRLIAQSIAAEIARVLQGELNAG